VTQALGGAAPPTRVVSSQHSTHVPMFQGVILTSFQSLVTAGGGQDQTSILMEPTHQYSVFVNGTGRQQSVTLPGEHAFNSGVAEAIRQSIQNSHPSRHCPCDQSTQTFQRPAFSNDACMRKCAAYGCARQRGRVACRMHERITHRCTVVRRQYVTLQAAPIDSPGPMTRKICT
jgi:hypothetical protein